MNKYLSPLMMLLLSVTFLEAGQKQLDDVPEDVDAGGGITYGGGYVWCSVGGESDGFYAYDINGDSWITLEPVPEFCEYFGAITYETGYERRIFVITTEDELHHYTKFYTTGYEGRWDEYLIELPEECGPGVSLAFQYVPSPVGPYTGYLYLLRGFETGDFYRRAIEVPEENPRGSPSRQYDWETLASIPVQAGAGSSICYNNRDGEWIYAFVGGGNSNFYRYSISSDNWEDLMDTPMSQNDGSSIVTCTRWQSRYLYGMFGENNKREYWYYDTDNDSWVQDDTLPREELGSGGSLTYQRVGHNLYLVVGGGKPYFYIKTNPYEEPEGTQSIVTMSMLPRGKVLYSSDRILVKYSINTPSQVKIQIYDRSGKLMKNLFNGNLESGEHLVSWDRTDKSGNTVSSGIYFVTIDKGNKIEQFKVIIGK